MDGFLTKFCGDLGYVTRTKQFDFGEDPNQDLDLRIFSVTFHHWEIGPKTTYTGYLKKVVDGFR